MTRPGLEGLCAYIDPWDENATNRQLVIRELALEIRTIARDQPPAEAWERLNVLAYELQRRTGAHQFMTRLELRPSPR